MTTSLLIWGLLDDRPGHAHQVRGLAQALVASFAAEGMSLPLAYTPIPLAYTPLSRLPNILLGHGIRHLTPDARAHLAPPWPDLVIACGRRTEPVARWIKRQHPAAKLVYLMTPSSLAGWDALVIPAHDTPPEDPRVLPTLGPIHAITPALLASAREAWAEAFARLPHPRVMVALGDARAAEPMLAAAERLAGEGSLLVTTSRRSPHELRGQLAPRLQRPYYWYDWHEGGENPYHGMLAHADALVIGGDSLSMCTEATATGKPVFIQQAAGLPSKHRALHAALFARGLARPLEMATSLDWHPASPLDEAGRIATLLQAQYWGGLQKYPV